MSNFQVNHFKMIATAIKRAEAILCTAGAGIGVDSGLPDFRGDHGFWTAYPALKGYSFDEMANPQWFKSDPKRAWGFYGHRLNLYRETIPHAGFQTMLKWIQDRPYFVFTSNVDGAFQKAGFETSKILECHGSIHHLQLLNGQGEIISADPYTVSVDEDVLLAADPLPRSSSGELLRPNILMFGDWYWDSTRTNKQHDEFERFLNQIKLDTLVIIEVGAGTAIPSVRMTGEALAERGATLIRINPREYQDASFGVSMGGLEGLKKIDEALSSME